MLRPDLHERNRLTWNAVTPAHNSHKGDQAAFLRGGGSTLFPEEIELLGDIAGRRLLHLQCNCGQDTLSLVQRGAIATGVDISDDAIAFARELSAASGLAAEFERDDVYPWLAAAAAAGRRFDVAFASYGVLLWLSDLAAWARGVAGVLPRGGRLVLVEFHPVTMMYDERGERAYSYFPGEPIECPGVGDYVAQAEGALSPTVHEEGVVDFRNPHPDYSFQHSMSELITSVLDAGFELRAFREYPYANGARMLPALEAVGARRWGFPAGAPSLPLMFGLVAERR
jgi:SAM-dependent methyltransferase